MPMPLMNHGVLSSKHTINLKLLPVVFLSLSFFIVSFDDFKKGYWSPVPGVTTEFRLDEGSGTVASDASGNNHPGTLSGATWTAGKYGQGVNLNGSSNYINIPDHADFTLTPTLSYTWSAWVKNNNFNQWSTVWSQTINTSNFFYFYAHSSTDAEAGPVTNGVSVYWYNGNNKLVIHSNNNVLVSGQWSYVTVTYNGSLAQNSRFTIYVNGTDATNRTDVVSSGTIAAIDPTNIRVGSNQPWGEYLNGAVDEVRYYRRLLSVSEIQTDMNTGNTGDTQSPTVNITAPAAGNVSGTINVNANAADNVGVVGVQFLDGATLIGAEDITAPYSVPWNTTGVSNGSHSLTARARDAAGNTTTSAVVIVNVNNTDAVSPTVNITAPAAGNVSGTINVNANAADNVGVVGVQFLDGATLIGAEDITAPYSVPWNTTGVSNGSHSLTARARDAAGNTTTSAVVIVNVSNTTATNLITALHLNEGTGTNAADISGKNHPGTLSGATWTTGKYGQAVNLNGSSNYITIPDHADFTLNPAQNYTWSGWVKNTNFNQWSTVWSQTINGSTFFYFYTHTSTDNDAGPVTNGVSVCWFNGSNKLAIHSNNNVLIAGQWSYIAITYNAGQTLANRFTIYVNGADVTNRTDVSSSGTIAAIDPTNIRIGANQPYGEYLNGAADEIRYYNRLLSLSEIQADMNTPLGNDNVAPTVNISTPANNATVSGTVNLTANASDNFAVAGVQFFLDGTTLIGTEDITSPYSISWNSLSASNAIHTLTARARDAAGNTTTSAGVTVTINNDTESPIVNLTAPAAGTIAGTINISADASDNTTIAGVQFLLNGNAIGTEDLTAPYTISWNTNTVNDGTYTLTARARDAAGNTTTSAGVVVNILNHPPDNEFPTIDITAPPAGDVVGTVNITANADDNVGVVGVQFFWNNSLIGSEDLTAPYSVSWNTLLINNGDYTLTAKARDGAGNVTTSANVVVTVNNPPDETLPNVNITSPTGGNVAGVINVTANASDNVGVAGVQFLLDGNNLGAEDLTAPYSVSWNTTGANGPHTLSAIARDAAGNTRNATNINVTVVANNPPVISGVSVSSITPTSAVINWATNIPATSQVKYGTTISYGFSTLVDGALVTSHSMILDGLSPNTLYHYQIISAEVNGGQTASGDNIFTSAALSSSLGNLNGHTILAYPAGKIIPWTSNPTLGYDSVMKLAWNYLLKTVTNDPSMKTVPNDPLTGKPAYYSRSYLNPNSQAVVDWPHNPAGLYGMLIECAIKYYAYSGNANVMQLAEEVALWHLDHGMTLATDNWPGVPYSSGDVGSLTYDGANKGNSSGEGDGDGYLEPDKIGELANSWLQLYKYNGNIRFRDAAIQAGNVLSNKIRVGTTNQSPWPFRINARTGAVREQYCSNIIAQITLLDNLIASGLGNIAAYQSARTAAWNWMMTYPMQTNVWAQYFEDVGIQTPYNYNLNQYNAMMTARYLLEHPEFDPNWETHVRGLISWVESVFGQSANGATIIKEQTPIFPYAMGSHSSRYASVNALLYEKTGDLVAKEKAYRSFNWSTYMARSNGVVIDGLLYGSADNANQWFTDGYGDYIRHFMTGLGAVPEWSPANQTHLVRSSSVIKNITYSANSINYTTYDASSIEVLHISFNPISITADGVALPKRSDLSQPGWTLDAATKTLRIYHNSATQISINGAASSQSFDLITMITERNKPVVQESFTINNQLINYSAIDGSSISNIKFRNIPATLNTKNQQKVDKIRTKDILSLSHVQ